MMAAQVVTGRSFAAADLPVNAGKAYRRENIVAGRLGARANGVRYGRPHVPAGRLAKVRAAIREGQGVREAARSAGIDAAKESRIKVQVIAAEHLT